MPLLTESASSSQHCIGKNPPSWNTHLLLAIVTTLYYITIIFLYQNRYYYINYKYTYLMARKILKLFGGYRFNEVSKLLHEPTEVLQLCPPLKLGYLWLFELVDCEFKNKILKKNKFYQWLKNSCIISGWEKVTKMRGSKDIKASRKYNFSCLTSWVFQLVATLYKMICFYVENLK